MSTAGSTRHVLLLNWRDTRNPEGGGSEVYVERIAAELVAAGHRATVLCAAHPAAPAEEVTEAGVRIVRRGGRFTVYLRAALCYLAAALRLGPLAGDRPDTIVDVGNGMPFLSALYARRPVIALVHHVHREQWPVVLPGWRGRLGWWIESRLAPRVYRRCRYVTVSQATREELAGLGVDPGRITVVHNGTPEAPAVPATRSATPELVVLGRLVPHKQVEMALHTVATLAGDVPELRLTVAGKGWWAPRLVALARELGIADRVDFTGYVADERKHLLFASAWVSLVPSLKEGWGLTIVEAGSHGTPTVAFRGAGGVREALIDGRTGLLADDHTDFTAKVRLLLTDEALRTAMGAAAKEHARGYSWQAAGQKFAALLPGAAKIPNQVGRVPVDAGAGQRVP
jgi:glycosyltransferase involved in cell wall biosynthesis